MAKKISLVLCLIYIITILGVSYVFAATPDSEVGVEIFFDKENYLPGDVAVVSLCLTGIEDEVEAATELAIFQTNLEFDSTEMTFIPTGEENGSNWNLDFNDSEDTKLFQVTENNDSIVVVAFHKNENIALQCDDNGRFVIANLKFTVGTPIDDSLEVEFSSKYAPVVGYVDQVNAENIDEYTCVVGDAISADVKDYLIADDSAVLDASGNIFVNASLGVVSGEGYLIAKLYDTATNRMVQPVVIKKIEDSRLSINDSEPLFTGVDAGTYKIELFFWRNLIHINPLAPRFDVEVLSYD